MPAVARAILDSRYSFTGQFLRGAGIFAKRAREIERTSGTPEVEGVISEHRAVVVAAIIHSSAALEAEIADIIDDQQTLDRYQIVLHLLRKEKFDPGRLPFQPTALLVRLRNELVHYKSKLGGEMDNIKFFESLRQLKHARPPFASPDSNFFPHHCLSADCAAWSVITALTFIDAFYGKLGILSPLESQRVDILGLLA